VRGGRADRATRRAGRGCGGARGGGLAESRRVAPRGRGRSPLRAGVPDRALHCADARLDRQALIARVLALSLLATGSEEIPAAAEHGLLLELDACLQVDEPSVQNLVELELRDARARSGNIPISVVVRCLDGAQEIRVEPWASRGDDGIRTIALPDAEDATATLEARSRELALAIAELIRRLEITRPLEPPPPPPPPPPPSVVSPPSPPEAPPGRWGIVALSSCDYFTGGQWLAGGDLSLAASLGRWTLGEVRVGGRFANGETLPSGRL